MDKVFKVIAHLLFEYGKANAGMPSILGFYEAPVSPGNFSIKLQMKKEGTLL